MSRKRLFLQENEFLLLKEIVVEGGILMLSVLLSNRSTKEMYRVKNRLTKNHFDRLVYGLEKNNFIKNENGKLSLTKLGEDIYKRNLVINKNKDKKKKWDQKWRMISFDIPNEFSNIRDSLRRILLRAGFLQIQKSVYIYPHEIKEIMLFLEENSDFKKYIIYAIITNSTAEKKWKEKFKEIILE